MEESYSSNVLVVYHSLVDDWEVDTVSHKLDDPSNNRNINHYWLVKNLLAKSLIQNHGLWKKEKELVIVVKLNCE